MTFTEDMIAIDDIINDKNLRDSEVDMAREQIADYIIKHWTEIKYRIGINR